MCTDMSNMLFTILVAAYACVQFAVGQLIPFSVNETRAFVDKHNNLRKGEGANNMKRIYWNKDLQSFAEQVAVRCKGHSENPYNVGGFRYVGENLSNGQTSEVVNGWFSEKPNFDAKKGKCTNDVQCMHYTQVVWAYTSDIGCGLAKCPNGYHLLACNYGPGGNIFAGDGLLPPPYTPGKPGSNCTSYEGHIADEDGLCVVPGRAKYGNIDNAACRYAMNKLQLVWLWILVICWYFMCQ